MYKSFIKRIIDIIVSFCVLILLSPIILLISIALFITNGIDIFFVQKRIGKNSKPFMLIKFRSMNDMRDKDGNLLKDVDRLTKVGKVFRKTSLDELPQLINVIKGDMSLVGPRPLLPEYLPYYSSYHIRRHEVAPGITGLAQVEGRSTLTFSQRFNLDVQYVDNLSFLLDLRILFRTALKVISSRKDVQLGVRPMSEIDDIGITRDLKRHYFNIDERKQ